MPGWLGDLVDVVTEVTGETSDYLNGRKELNLNNAANSLGKVTGSVLTKTGVLDKTDQQSQFSGAAVSAANGFNQSTNYITNLILGEVTKFIKSNLIYIIGGGVAIYFIFKKK